MDWKWLRDMWSRMHTSREERIDAILTLLAQRGEMTGGQLIEAAPNKLPGGTTYTLLAQMEDEDLIVSRVAEEDTFKRRFYRITGNGRRFTAPRYASELRYHPART